MTPHKCPVCDGAGKVSRPPHLAGDIETWDSYDGGPWICHGCDGTGIVWEPNKILQGEVVISCGPTNTFFNNPNIITSNTF